MIPIEKLWYFQHAQRISFQSIFDQLDRLVINEFIQRKTEEQYVHYLENTTFDYVCTRTEYMIFCSVLDVKKSFWMYFMPRQENIAELKILKGLPSLIPL